MLALPQKAKGFTLIELVTVIVILGIVATSITTFLRFGTQSYTDAADREEIIATARFAIERLNREIRAALPNSIRTIGQNNQCLEFTPILQSAIYLDIPVAPESASNIINVLMLDEAITSTNKYVSVYALNSDDVYDKTAGVIEEYSTLNNSGDKQTPSIINFASAILFKAESPTSRLYFIDRPVSYCVEGNSLYRYQGYTGYNAADLPLGSGVTMADFLDNFSDSGNIIPFQALPATLQRNAMAIIKLKFLRNLETIIFSHEIQVPNVP
tara:strand:+ start:3744 stop:4553 length:810 start_codon:yes stop_codon:yes gene_type:complete